MADNTEGDRQARHLAFDICRLTKQLEMVCHPDAAGAVAMAADLRDAAERLDGLADRVDEVVASRSRKKKGRVSK